MHRTFTYIEREVEKVPEHIPVLVLGNHRDMGHHRTVAEDKARYFCHHYDRLVKMLYYFKAMSLMSFETFYNGQTIFCGVFNFCVFLWFIQLQINSPIANVKFPLKTVITSSKFKYPLTNANFRNQGGFH